MAKESQRRLQDDLSDADLLLAFAEGESTAFETLYLRHSDYTLRIALKLSNDRNTAEEIAQNVWLKIIQNPFIFSDREPTGKFRTFLAVVLRNNYLDKLRASDTRIFNPQTEDVDKHLETLVDEAGDLPEQYVDKEISHNYLKQRLDSLPTKQREVMSLWLTGHSVKDISFILGAKHESIKSRLKYARQKLAAACL